MCLMNLHIFYIRLTSELASTLLILPSPRLLWSGVMRDLMLFFFLSPPDLRHSHGSIGMYTIHTLFFLYVNSTSLSLSFLLSDFFFRLQIFPFLFFHPFPFPFPSYSRKSPNFRLCKHSHNCFFFCLFILFFY